ncbi:MAG: hypothetical protein B1H03_05450 [Planctomycetales bacterium 4484_113]|nr:MAG: hypothetical protein B1H03_05450 [Planctomycetales bacterium 4484_113]
MASGEESDAIHRARVMRAARELLAEVHRRDALPPEASRRTPSPPLPAQRPQPVIVPSERCFVCGNEAVSGVLLPGSVVFYFCEQHLAAGQHLAESTWRRHRQKQEYGELVAHLRERAEDLWLELMKAARLR